MLWHSNNQQSVTHIMDFILRMIGFHRCEIFTMTTWCASWGPAWNSHTRVCWRSIVRKEAFKTSWKMSSSNWIGCSVTASCTILWRCVTLRVRLCERARLRAHSCVLYVCARACVQSTSELTHFNNNLFVENKEENKFVFTCTVFYALRSFNVEYGA